MDRLVQQLETKRISLLDIVRHDCFADGYIEVQKGLALDPDYDGKRGDAWFYERGRLTAVVLRRMYARIPPLWTETDQGSVINPQVLSAAGAAFSIGDVI
jgi:hypothetical protein